MKKYIIGFFRKCDMLTMTGTTIAFLGMICAFKAHFTVAAFCLLLCGICDSFDGTLARKYKYSKEAQEYGVQLDSLSDVICFGLLPAIITILISNGSVLSTIICIYYMLCGVIRLAYFNMLHATKTAKKGEYVGLPITTAAFVYPVVFFLIRLIKPDLLNIILPIILLCMGTLFIGRFKFKKPNIKKIISTLFNKYTINLIFLPLFIVISGDIFYRTQSLHLFTILKQSIFVIANHFIPFIFIYLLITLIFIIINGLTNRSGITKIILLLLSLIIFIISDIKLNIMGIPIELSDISYLNPDNMGMMATATTTIGSWIWLTIAKGILFLALIIGIIYLDKFSKLKIEKLSKRLTALAITTVAFTLIIILMVNKNTFVINKIYGTNKESLYQYASVDSFTEDFGFFQGIILSSLSKRELVPDGYDAAYVEKLLEKYDNQKTSGEWKKANVVFLLSESFSDLENIDEETFDKPLMSELDSYAKDKDKMVFDLLVPTFGGGSVNTEFEILTGASISFWSPGFIPYNQYYKGTTGKDAPNIIKEFNNNGYTTMYLTPWGETSFNSKKNYEIFGATKTIYGTDLKGSNKGIYYSDKSLMEDIYNELKDTSEGNYKFIMAATAQNHFPFSKDKYDKYDINVKNTTYSAEDTALLRSYAQGIYDASKELNNLYQMIKKLDVPTIIVFFGDHLPYIIDSHSSQPYLESSYFTSPDKTICNLREYTTKAAILSNYDIKTDDIEYMNANYLGAYVLNKLDLNISSYFKYVEDMRKKIQAFNRQGLYQNNEIIPFDNTDKIIQEAIKSYKYVQYKSFYEISK